MMPFSPYFVNQNKLKDQPRFRGWQNRVFLMREATCMCYNVKNFWQLFLKVNHYKQLRMKSTGNSKM
jgi:hypothetical protein